MSSRGRYARRYSEDFLIFQVPSSVARLDVFAVTVCLWWSAINLLDAAIYCADSRAGQLMLLDGLTGKESEGMTGTTCSPAGDCWSTTR